MKDLRMSPEHDTYEILKTVLDWLAGLITIGTVMQWIPAVAAIITGCYGAARLYELGSGRKFADTRLARFIFGNK